MRNKKETINKSNEIFITEEDPDVDVLDRKEFIENIIKIVEYYAEKKQSVSFSIQGPWGSGKSWIINKVYNELYDMQDFDSCGSKYCIFTYNAWDFDYYDEPLISLFISIYKQLNNENVLFIKNEKTREKVKVLFETLKDCFLEELKPIPLIGSIINFKQDYDETRESLHDTIRKYDYHFDINQIMEATINGLRRIANQKQLVIIVDELDRCLPEYAIKVLERMHHISKNVQNIQIIYSIDKNQIEETVRNIYGQKVNASDYLKKFFGFGFNLSSGNLNEQFSIKYKNLFKNFDFIFCDNFDKEKGFSAILLETNMRERENIIQKVELINSILNNEQKILDISILYVELFLANCFADGIYISSSEIHYDNNKLTLLVTDNNTQLKLTSKLSVFFENLSHSHKVEHKPHGYEGFYNAEIEYVIYNLLNNLINIQLPQYYIAPETEFYRFGLDFLMNFIKLYKSIEM